mmetsp:Transcript_83249/g.137654  ORF Transcript_83249/g.137654 Transcript_83249/m.137654 type:complete len:103 (+) Transcript_83249:973-1281(+)
MHVDRVAVQCTSLCLYFFDVFKIALRRIVSHTSFTTSINPLTFSAQNVLQSKKLKKMIWILSCVMLVWVKYPFATEACMIKLLPRTWLTAKDLETISIWACT